jgi:hypothetical protein
MKTLLNTGTAELGFDLRRLLTAEGETIRQRR